MTHGFFVVMGGFMERDKHGRSVRTLDADSIPEEVKKDISRVYIEDKSKGDILSKAFALLQTGWFILQCIARKISGLPVTQLEVATVAFAVLNFAMYIVWWRKPQNVGYAVQVSKKEESGSDDEGGERGERADDRGRWTEFKRGLMDIPNEIYRPVAGLADDFGPGSILAFPLFPFWCILFADSYEKNPRRVGTFSPKLDDDEYALAISAVVGIVFGGIHCIAWAFVFPSDTEQLLWRISALSVTCAPLLVSLASWMVFFNTFGQFFAVLVFLVPACLMYFFGRLVLLALPFMSLRALPSGAFRTVDWTRFIPHI